VEGESAALGAAMQAAAALENVNAGEYVKAHPPAVLDEVETPDATRWMRCGRGTRCSWRKDALCSRSRLVRVTFNEDGECAARGFVHICSRSRLGGFI